MGTNFIDVKVLDNGIPVEDAMVTLLKGNDEIFVSGYSNAGGNVTLRAEGGVLDVASPWVTAAAGERRAVAIGIDDAQLSQLFVSVRRG